MLVFTFAVCCSVNCSRNDALPHEDLALGPMMTTGPGKIGVYTRKAPKEVRKTASPIHQPVQLPVLMLWLSGASFISVLTSELQSCYTTLTCQPDRETQLCVFSL